MQYGLVVVWLAAYLVLALAALPLAGLLFARLADRGAAFAFPLALAVLGVVGYLAGHVAFGWPALLAGLAVLVGASYASTRADADVDRRGYAEAAVVFAVAFLFLVAVRAVDPAVHPILGEKFLDFGLLKSLLRTGRLPPEDMWFAGEPVRYYYIGHMIAALLARLTFTPGKYAYNLALAGYYAAYVTAAWGLASNVAAAYGGSRRGWAGADSASRLTRRRLAGGLGAFFVAVAGNLATPGRVLLWALPDGVARALAGAAGLPGRVLAWTPGQFYYWDASRVIPLTPGDPDSIRIATEFPLFAWLNGDLQGHMMAPAFLLLVAGLLLSYWLTPEENCRTRRALVFGAIPPVSGLIATVNTWSALTPGGLTLLVLTFAPADPATLFPERVATRLRTVARANGGAVATADGTLDPRAWLREEVTRTGTALVLAAGVLALGAAWVLPFWLGTASGRPLGFFPDRSPLGGLLLVHGVFLAVFVPYLAQRGLAGVDEPLTTVGMAVLAGLAAWFAGFAAVGLFGPLLVVGWVLLRTRRDAGFETVLFVGGAGLVLLVEFVYVQEQAGPGRFNTVFKTYAQVWALWAPAAGVALARLATAAPDLPEFDLSEARAERWRRAGAALAVVLVFTSSVYAAFALPSHFARGGAAASLDDPTLDATAFVAVQHPGEAPAIEWIDGLEGQPNIVTAAPGGYFWNPSEGKGASAPASLTGVPTVLGWFHEIGYRGEEPFRERVKDVRTIYTGSTGDQADLLRRYNVEYVYVGPAERAHYETVTVDRVPGVEAHKRLGDVVIYRVNEDALPG